MGQRLGAGTAFGPVFGQHHVHATGPHGTADEVQLGLGIGIEAVDGHDSGQAEAAGDVVDVAFEVGHAFFQCGQILGAQFLHGNAAVVLEGTHGGDDDAGIGPEAGLAALDVEKLLGAQVGAEAGFGDDIVGQLQARTGGDDRAAAVGDVGKGSAMQQRRVVFQGLHQVGLDGVAQQHGHGAMDLQLPCSQGLALAVQTEDDLAQALAQVHQRRGQAEDGHDFAGHHNVEAILARLAVHVAAQAHDGAAQGPVIHVHHPLPVDAGGIDVQFVAVVDVVVDGGRQQVVGLADGSEVAGEVEVDVLHGHDLGVTAARCPPLDAEDRPHGWFAQADHRLSADAVEGIAQTDREGGLALAGRRGADGGDQHQSAVLPFGLAVEPVQRDLGLVVAVRLQGVIGDAGPGGNMADALQAGVLSDLDVGGHGVVSFLGSAEGRMASPGTGRTGMP